MYTYGASERDIKKNYPPGSKSEALQLGVHLILLYFIGSDLECGDFFFILVGGWWWMPTFWSFKSLDINMVYTLDVYVYI